LVPDKEYGQQPGNGPKGKEIYDIEATDMGDIKEEKGMKWENRGQV